MCIRDRRESAIEFVTGSKSEICRTCQNLPNLPRPWDGKLKAKTAQDSDFSSSFSSRSSWEMHPCHMQGCITKPLCHIPLLQGIAKGGFFMACFFFIKGTWSLELIPCVQGPCGRQMAGPRESAIEFVTGSKSEFCRTCPGLGLANGEPRASKTPTAPPSFSSRSSLEISQLHIQGCGTVSYTHLTLPTKA